MRARKRVLLLTASGGVLLLLGLALWIVYSFQHFALNFSKEDAATLINSVKAGAANLVVLKQSHERASINAYNLTPARLQNDAKLFDAWTSTSQVARETFKSAPAGNWIRSSTDASYLTTAQRYDSWGHSVCILRRTDTVVVVSAGPRASGSPVCRNIQISETELGQLPHGRLLESPSGNLILVVGEDRRVVQAVP